MPGYPRIWAPFNLLVIVPAFLLGEQFSVDVALLIAPLSVPFFFLIWTMPATWIGPKPPKRTLIFAFFAVSLSVASLVLGYSYGVEYHGISYVIGTLITSALCWTAIAVAGITAVLKPSVGRNLTFHIAFFAWLAWYAIPYMGELP
jgi:hypothetical protein